ncbi:Beta-lactamase domain protein [Candidatus Sulfopaludibacter sp. SbA4]|nr:Beta-lactamase domain protein [Candidatus Sulfopaludibacter sp. SbA4]
MHTLPFDFSRATGYASYMPEGSYGFQVGSICCTVLSDGYFSFPTPWFFPNADPGELTRALDKRRLPRESVLSPYTCLLIEIGRHVVLVDTGGGPSSPASGALVARLEMAGIRPRDVDTVVLTHAHPDHIGGALNPIGRPAFPNARYVLSEIEWDFWTAARTDLSGLHLPEDLKGAMASTARRCLGALRFQVEPIDGESEIVPGVRAIPAPGHTPGHLAILLSSEGRHLLNVGDAAVHPLHLEQPGWENAFDLSAGVAMATRRDLVERAAAGNMHLMAFHFPFPSVGRVAKLEAGGWEWSPGW